MTFHLGISCILYKQQFTQYLIYYLNFDQAVFTHSRCLKAQVSHENAAIKFKTTLSIWVNRFLRDFSNDMAEYRERNLNMDHKNG